MTKRNRERNEKLVDGVYVDFTSIASFSGDTVTLHLTDGGPADSDGVVNGVIVDPIVIVHRDATQCPSTCAAVVSSASLAVIGQTVTLTATATDATTPTASLKGTMRFYDGTTLLASKPVKAGVATLITKKLTVGAHPITVTYTKSGTTTPMTSSVWTQLVNAATTQVTLMSPVNPSIHGRTAAFKATVVRVAPGVGKVLGGTITFFDNGTPLATVTAKNGKAIYKTTLLTVGSHQITATYNGSTTDLTSSTATAITQTIT